MVNVISKKANLKDCPSIKIESVKHTQVTFPDGHANALLLIHKCLQEGVFRLSGDDGKQKKLYQELYDIYYKEGNYSAFEINVKFINKEPENGDNTRYRCPTLLKTNNGKLFLYSEVSRPHTTFKTTSEIKNAVKLFKWIQNEGTLNLSESQNKILYNAINTKIFKDAPLKLSFYKHTKADFDRFKEILANIIPNKKMLLRLLGDIMCDRGENGKFIQDFLGALNNKSIPYEILFSNHDRGFVKSLLDKEKNKFLKNTSTINHRLQATSLNKLITAIENNHVSYNQFEKSLKDNYFPNLKLISYSLSKAKIDNQHINLFAHAAFDLKMLNDALVDFGYDTIDDFPTIKALTTAIDNINKKFSEVITNKEKFEKFFSNIDINIAANASSQAKAACKLIWARHDTNYSFTRPHTLEDYALYLCKDKPKLKNFMPGIIYLKKESDNNYSYFISNHFGKLIKEKKLSNNLHDKVKKLNWNDIKSDTQAIKAKGENLIDIETELSGKPSRKENYKIFYYFGHVGSKDFGYDYAKNKHVCNLDKSNLGKFSLGKYQKGEHIALQTNDVSSLNTPSKNENENLKNKTAINSETVLTKQFTKNKENTNRTIKTLLEKNVHDNKGNKVFFYSTPATNIHLLTGFKDEKLKSSVNKHNASDFADMQGTLVKVNNENKSPQVSGEITYSRSEENKKEKITLLADTMLSVHIGMHGKNNCELSGNSKDALYQKIIQLAREKYNMKIIDPNIKLQFNKENSSNKNTLEKNKKYAKNYKEELNIVEEKENVTPNVFQK